MGATVTFPALLTLAAFGLVAITVAFSVTEMDLINACCYGNSALWLMSVEVFHSHLVLLGMLEEGCICGFLSLLFWSDPFFWLWNAWLHETATLFYIPSAHLWRGAGTIQQCLLCVGLVGQLSLALHVGCHCTSHQCGSSRRLTLLGCLQWPWTLPKDSFGFPHLLKWAVCFTI